MNTTTLNMTTLDGGVIIKKGTAPAPPSGGESGGSDIEYLDVRGRIPQTPSGAEGLLTTSYMIRMSGKNMPPVFALSIIRDPNDILAVSIDLNVEIYALDKYINVRDFLIENGVDISSFPRLTKEQFYNLE